MDDFPSGATQLDYYEHSFLTTRERLIRVLGCPTVDRIVERAAREVERAHPAIGQLRWDDDEIDLTLVRQALDDAGPDEVRDAYNALNGVLIVIVARLLGREVATRLTEGIAVSEWLIPGGGA
jgi:hypothetical protein